MTPARIVKHVHNCTGLAGLLALSCVVAAPTSAHASTPDLFGFGARPAAMAGLGGSISDDFSAVHSNPAGLARARETAFTLGFQGAGFDLSLSRATGTREHIPQDIARGTVIGLVLPLPFEGVLRDRIAIGVGFYTPTDVVVRGRILRPELPQFLLLSDRTQTVTIQGALGVDLGWGLRVGAGFSALAAIRGAVVIAQDSTGRVGSRVDNQLVTSYAPIVGASLERGPIRAGLTFRGATIGRFAVTIEARDVGLPLPVFNIAGLAQYDPWQFAGEFGFVHQGWSALVGLTFKRWSEYPGPLERTTERSPEPPRPALWDTFVPRAAIERRWSSARSGLAVRGGYFYEPTPVPARTAGANYFDNDRHVLTTGVAVDTRWRGTKATVELFAQLHILAPRETSDGAQPEPASPTWRTAGSLFAMGTSLTLTF
ncbi:MAG: hypothetical protein Q8Q09_26660 [Deltaproteobacteria bacterium]|nr:hypothetical protein [Deltaproteobacteria bacterium]